MKSVTSDHDPMVRYSVIQDSPEQLVIELACGIDQVFGVIEARRLAKKSGRPVKILKTNRGDLEITPNMTFEEARALVA